MWRDGEAVVQQPSETPTDNTQSAVDTIAYWSEESRNDPGYSSSDDDYSDTDSDSEETTSNSDTWGGSTSEEDSYHSVNDE